MNQNQCVPNWDLDDLDPIIIHPPPPPPRPPPPVSRSLNSHSASLSSGHETSTQDYERAELAWENGHLTMHGLGLPRASSRNNMDDAWIDQKPAIGANGTLESLVDQATYKLLKSTHTPAPAGVCQDEDDLVPLFDPNQMIHYSTGLNPVSIPLDALVPNAINLDMGANKAAMGCSTRVGSCSAAAPGVPAYSDWSVSVSGSDRWPRAKRAPDDTSEQLRSMTNYEITSTSFGASVDNTTRTVTFDDRGDHDSVCRSKPKRERLDEEENKKKSNSTSKRSRAAAVHNQSERKRRDKINQRMKTLQKLVPNSNKTDKASMLDEVIEYLKKLQSQIQMLNTMRSPSMMMPLAIQQQLLLLQISMMAPMGIGIGMGMGSEMGINMLPNHMNLNMNTNMNSIGQPNIPGIPPSVLNPTAFMSLAANTCDGDRVTTQPASMAPTDPLSMYLASQSHSMAVGAYNKVATMYQQLQQQQQQQQSPNQGPRNK